MIFLLSVQNEEGARLTVETPQTAEAARDAAERADIKQRAATGAALVAARGLSTQLLALAGNIVLARLLVPDELGAVAFGTTIVVWERSSPTPAWARR